MQQAERQALAEARGKIRRGHRLIGEAALKRGRTMDETTKPTAVQQIACCSCNANFRQRVRSGGKWRQRSMLVPGPSNPVCAYLCPVCADRFSSDEAVDDFLSAALDTQMSASG